MISWKVVVASGTVAVVLSLLTGIISGVHFGTLLLRALLWGAIFCGIGAVISLVISKYLPELLSPPSGGDRDDAQSARNVDIVLPDENPHAFEEAEPEGNTQEQSSGFEEPSGAEKVEDSESWSAGPDLAVDDSMVEEVDVRREDAGLGRQGHGLFDDESAGSEELPDLDASDEQFDPSLGGNDFRATDLSDITGASGSGRSVDVLGHTADAEEIAKAIRTALNKDQKG